MDTKENQEVEDVEIRLLLEGMYQVYGWDFRDYAKASLKRRIWKCVREEHLASVSSYQERILHDPACMQRFLLAVSVDTTEMFRDPWFYVAFRKKVVELLWPLPSVRIWHVGCATGEEVYSLAILLEEEGLYGKCRLYATDMNEALLVEAREGIFPLETMQGYTDNYLKAGGKRAFSDTTRPATSAPCSGPPCRRTSSGRSTTS
jgi:chemotaxis protein methyltransferase CheR